WSSSTVSSRSPYTACWRRRVSPTARRNWKTAIGGSLFSRTGIEGRAVWRGGPIEPPRGGSWRMEGVHRRPCGAVAADRLRSQVVINSFEPKPLYRVLEAEGFAHRAEELENGDWRITFFKNGD